MDIQSFGLAIIGGIGAFAGFYFSDIAKKSLRARHVSFQAFAYVTGAQNAFLTSSQIPDLQPFVRRWTNARNSHLASINKVDDHRLSLFLQIDKRQLARMSRILNTVKAEEKLHNYLAYLVKNPGINQAQIVASERMFHTIDKWNDHLPDSDVALLGPEVLAHYIQYRTAFTSFATATMQMCVCIRDTPKGTNYEPTYLIATSITAVKSWVRAQMELEMLLPLIQKSMARSLPKLFGTFIGKPKYF